MVDYGNWVSKKFIFWPAAIGIVFLALSILYLPLAVIAALFLLIAAYFAYARYVFSPGGNGIQQRIRGLILARMDWDGKGKALDIGCGNGALVIGLAKKYPGAMVTGIDYWGKGWDYSKHACENNAVAEGVGERVTFLKASASDLPFDDGYFDAVVSNLTFHEVKDARDKREVLKEALRVVKKGGSFVFQDLFLMKTVYGDIDRLLETIKGWGVENVEFIRTSDEPFIPVALKLPFMVGTIGIISGKK